MNRARPSRRIALAFVALLFLATFVGMVGISAPIAATGPFYANFASGGTTSALTVTTGSLTINTVDDAICVVAMVDYTTVTSASVTAVSDNPNHDSFTSEITNSYAAGFQQLEAWCAFNLPSTTAQTVTVNITTGTSAAAPFAVIAVDIAEWPVLTAKGSVGTFTGTDTVGTTSTVTPTTANSLLIGAGFMTRTRTGSLSVSGGLAYNQICGGCVLEGPGSAGINPVEGRAPNALATGYTFTMVGNAGTTASMSLLSMAFKTNPAAAPSPFTATNGGQRVINLAWTAPSGPLANYTIEIGLSSGVYTSWVNVVAPATSYSNTGLNPGTTYYYSIWAWVSGVAGAHAAEAHAATTPAPPTVPSDLNAVGASLTTAVLTWTAPTAGGSVVNSTVAYGTTYGTYTGWSNVAGAAAHTTVSGLALNTTYYSTVFSWSLGGAGNDSNVAPFHTLARPPLWVGNATLIATGVTLNSVTLTWSPPANTTVLNYTVYYGSTYHNTYAGYGSSASAGLVTTDTIAGLTLNTTYYFVVASWTSATLRGPPSNVAVAHTLGRAALTVGAPVLEAVGSSLTGVALTWTAPANVTVVNYTLYRSTSYALPLTTSAVSEGSALDVAVTGLSPNTTYYFQIGTWTSATLRGPYSEIAVAHTLAGPAPIVGSPVLSVAGISLAAIALTWSAPANVSVVNYTAYYGTTYHATYSGYASSVNAGNVLDLTISGLSQNTTYWLLIQSWTSATVRGPVSEVTVAHTFWSPAPIVGGFVLTGAAYVNGAGWMPVDGSLVALNWTAPANVTVLNYTLYEAPWPCETLYYQLAGCLGGSVTSLGGAATYPNGGTFTGSMPYNTTYEFVLGTWISPTVRGPSSNWVVVTSPFDSQRAPILSVTAVSETSVTLAWTAAVNETVLNYTIEWGTSYGVYGHHVSEGLALDASIGGLAADTSYWFVVVAWRSASVSDFPASNAAPAHTQPIPTAQTPLPNDLITYDDALVTAFLIALGVGFVFYLLARRQRYL